jgi:hypothetical protein
MYPRKEGIMATPTEFLLKDWNLDLRAELYKREFYMTRTWMYERDRMVHPWADRITDELAALRHLKEVERQDHLGHIVREQYLDVLVGYWFDLLEIGPRSHFRTTELLRATISLAGSVSTYFKARFNRVRPAAIGPDLAPPIPSPRLPAYPSGHATQAHLMARTLAHLAPAKSKPIMDLAADIARNRERAGLNYPSDTVAGEDLARQVFDVLTDECVLFRSTLQHTSDTEWNPAKSSRVGTPRSAVLPA